MTVSPEYLLAHIKKRQSERGESMSCDVRRYSAALAILRFWFGDPWVQKIIDLRKAKSTYIRLDDSTDLLRLRHQERVERLAESLLNFQTTLNFSDCIRELSSGKSIEAMIAKFDAAALLRRGQVPFEFVVPQERKGLDFDVTALPSGISTACEMKGRIEQAAIDPRAIGKLLRRAREQMMGHDGPRVAFIKVPESWIAEPEKSSTLSRVVSEYLASTVQLTKVIVHFEVWAETVIGVYVGGFIYHEWTNEDAKYPLPPGPLLVEPIYGKEGLWISIREIVCEGLAA